MEYQLDREIVAVLRRIGTSSDDDATRISRVNRLFKRGSGEC